MATIEIDGKTFEVENGKMIIEVADEAGIHIPRFCYHKKLSVAANCRMCLVEIENSKKTVPACATPISQGMKVYTQSAAALKSQKAVMEFLLINHPLDCPICDQGGECELQDVSMGYGESEGEYLESKRAVEDKNLGTLIQTEMTRCIHCTRCVRFGEEIAGLREMGAPGRGEHVEIGTYVEKSLQSEISGNIIDLCPVGALTSKPYRYSARSWELTQKPGIAPHDCLGSHVFLHTRRGRLMRVVPREEESINEIWLSDRDRFSYTGSYHENRLAQPMIKQNGRWKAVDWASALNFTASKLGEVLEKFGPESVAALASPSSTTEEFYILQKWMRSLKIQNIDHRVRQTDFSGDSYQFALPQNNLVYAEIENQQSILLFATDLKREVPLAMAKVRKAYLNGAKIASVNMADYKFTAPVDEMILCHPMKFEHQLLALAKALKVKWVGALASRAKDIKVEECHQAIADFMSQERAVIMTGEVLQNHPRFHVLQYILTEITRQTSIKWIHLPSGANANGAWQAGFVPHFNPAGEVNTDVGLNVHQMMFAQLKAFVLHYLDPEYDFDDAMSMKKALLASQFVVAVTPFRTKALDETADVLLPMSIFAETSGTFINLDGQWQSFEGAAIPFESARPGWKIYRVLANLTHCKGFDYVSSEEILSELKNIKIQPCSLVHDEISFEKEIEVTSEGIMRVGTAALYGVDMLTRHAISLNHSASADVLEVKIHSKLADELGIREKVTVTSGDNALTLPVRIDDSMQKNLVWIPAACGESTVLGSSYAQVELTPV